ncbi:LamG domain-containing protein, partial [Methylobacterium sp. J-030]|uniref:LamG domain-containing protein n=1 Tax=Methylobacterium sp. J-030 TaxID=2836627 RepID=UPI001FBB57BA
MHAGDLRHGRQPHDGDRDPAAPPHQPAGGPDGINGATAIPDAVSGNTVTRGGSAAISTAQSAFGGASLRLASTTSYLAIAYASPVAIGTGDFTVEGYVWFDGVGSAQVIFATTSASNAAGFYIFLRGSDGKLALQDYASGTAYSVSATTPAANTKVGFAFVRKAGTLYTYINNTLENSVAYTANLGTLTGYRLGGDTAGNNGAVVYLDEVRSSNSARYIGSTYPVATQPFVVGTSGLLDLRSIARPLLVVPTKAILYARVLEDGGLAELRLGRQSHRLGQSHRQRRGRLRGHVHADRCGPG